MSRLFGIFAFIFVTTLCFTPAIAQVSDPEWRSIANQAERIVQRPDSTLFSLTRLKEELHVWRNKFSSEKDFNAGRLQTVAAQLAALGPVSEDKESNELATRRAELLSQQAELFAPAALANEAFAQVDGLISEVDTRIRARQREALTTRNSSPLLPRHWFGALANFGDGLTKIINGAGSSINLAIATPRVQAMLPVSILAILIGIWLLLRGKIFGHRLTLDAESSQSRWAPLMSFGASLLGLFLPLSGLALIYWSILRLNVIGNPMAPVITGILLAASILIAARWLISRFFPSFDEQGPMQYDAGTRDRLRKLSFNLAIGLALIAVVEMVSSLTETSAASRGVLMLPINVVLGVILFRFGKALQTPPQGADINAGVGRTRRIIGLISMVIAVATPVLTALGYSAASKALFAPWLLSLAVFAVLLLLQRLVATTWALRQGLEDSERGSLAPVLLGAMFFLLSIPLLALIWGAQWSDILDWWSRFQEGFSFGNTTLSPTDFITFVVVFAVGYLLTKFIQGALRRSVLPRTKLDLGGQNAIVAGVGYIGVILAAVVAITSAGIDLSSLAIVAGALSVGIGFGLQNIVSNFVSGVILLIERPVSEGDWIEVNGQMGYVKNISVRSTQIETFDRTDVIIPNADLVSGQVTNWTRGNSVGRLIISVGVAYGSDVERVMEILNEIALSHPMVLHNPKPSVLFQNFGASSLDFEIRAILRDVNFMLSVKSEINIEIARQFEKAGIEIPFPQQDVWLRNPVDTRQDGGLND